MTLLEALKVKEETQKFIDSQLDELAAMILLLHRAEVDPHSTIVEIYDEPVRDGIAQICNFTDLGNDYLGGEDNEPFIAIKVMWYEDEEYDDDWYYLPKTWLAGDKLDASSEFIRNDAELRHKRMQEHREYVKAECERIREERRRKEIEKKQKAEAERAAYEKEERRKLYEELKKEFEPSEKGLGNDESTKV